MYYTYIHYKDTNKQPFYVGKGIGKRAWSTSNRNLHWKNTVSKHGFSAEIIGRWDSEPEAFEHEQFLISCFRDLGHKLVNQTAGGEGSSGRVASEQFRQRASAAAKARFSSEAERAKASQAAIRRMADVAARQAVSDGLRQHYSSQEARDRLRRQGIKQASNPEMRRRMIEAGRVVAVPVKCVESNLDFASLKEAIAWLATKGMAKAQGNPIALAARGTRKTAYGYTWQLVQKEN